MKKVQGQGDGNESLSIPNRKRRHIMHRSLSEPCGEDDERKNIIHNLWCGTMGFTTRIAAVQTNSSFADATPLLGKDGANVAVDKSVKSNKLEGTRGDNDVARVTSLRIFKSALAFLVAAASLAASILSFIISPATIVYIMGVMCSLNFALITCKEWRILLLGS